MGLLETKQNNLAFAEIFVSTYLMHIDGVKTAQELGCKVTASDIPAGYYVYGLIDPRNNSIFYFGKGKNKRWMDHYKEKRRLSSAKHVRINSGIDPFCVIVLDNLQEDDAFLVEKYLISSLSGQLTNIRPGDSPHVSRLQKSKDDCKAILKTVIPFDQWILIKSRAEEEIKYYHKFVAQVTKIATFGDVEAIFWHRWNPETRTWVNTWKSSAPAGKRDLKSGV